MWGSRTGMQQGALQLAQVRQWRRARGGRAEKMYLSSRLSPPHTPSHRQTAISLGFGALSGVLVGWIMTWNVFEPKTGFFYKDDADWSIVRARKGGQILAVWPLNSRHSHRCTPTGARPRRRLTRRGVPRARRLRRLPCGTRPRVHLLPLHSRPRRAG